MQKDKMAVKRGGAPKIIETAILALLLPYNWLFQNPNPNPTEQLIG